MLVPIAFALGLLVGPDPDRTVLLGMDSSRNITPMLVQLYEEGPRTDYLSRDLAKQLQASGGLDFRWLYGPSGGPAQDLSMYVLNTTGAHDGRPMSASVGARFIDGGEEVYRRFSMIEQDGVWVIHNVCLFPERRTVRGQDC